VIAKEVKGERLKAKGGFSTDSPFAFYFLVLPARQGVKTQLRLTFNP
jgi:hypothetical protein